MPMRVQSKHFAQRMCFPYRPRRHCLKDAKDTVHLRAEAAGAHAKESGLCNTNNGSRGVLVGRVRRFTFHTLSCQLIHTQWVVDVVWICANRVARWVQHLRRWQRHLDFVQKGLVRCKRTLEHVGASYRHRRASDARRRTRKYDAAGAGKRAQRWQAARTRHGLVQTFGVILGRGVRVSHAAAAAQVVVGLIAVVGIACFHVSYAFFLASKRPKKECYFRFITLTSRMQNKRRKNIVLYGILCHLNKDGACPKIKSHA